MTPLATYIRARKTAVLLATLLTEYPERMFLPAGVSLNALARGMVR